MAYTTINKGADYFNTKLYTGNGSTQSITGVGFQPDMTWVKSRTTGGSTNNNHCINDVVRAKGSFGYPMIHPNLTAVEYDPTSGNEVVIDFQSDGFSLGGNENSNYNTATYVAWNWLANNTSGSSNTDGSITSTVSANTTSGFSIVSYQGTSVAGTIGHGLGVAPKMIIIKRRTAFAEDWLVYHASLGATKNLKLNTTASEATSSSPFNDTAPTSTVFSVKDDGTTNSSSSTYIAYCFAEKKGFSKFGSYTGNGNADGTFVYTGFKPAFFIGKRTDTTGNWLMYDNKRNTYNLVGTSLATDESRAEATEANGIDFTSNGIKMRNTFSNLNASGGTYIYMCFAENPFVSSTGTPVTAR